MAGQDRRLTRAAAAPHLALPPLSQGCQLAIDGFIDSLWLEAGLARLTLEAYRRDLVLFARWLAQASPGQGIDATTVGDLNAYFSHRHAQTKATTANRRLTVFKRYFRWALREGRIQADPTLQMLSAKQPMRVPKSLTER